MLREDTRSQLSLSSPAEGKSVEWTAGWQSQ